jgi:flavin-dependent dehydrogenase
MKDAATVAGHSGERIAVVGGGPAGAFAAALLAQAGRCVTLFDERMAWEKPCGGGLTTKTLERYPFLRDNLQSKKMVSRVEMSLLGGPSTRFTLRDPVCIYSRHTLNQLLLDRALDAGAQLVQRRITAIQRDGATWRLRGTQGEYAASFLVLASGARNPFSGFGLPQSQADTSMTLGYFVPGQREAMEIEFQSGLEGYLWIFPRDTHSSVGICGTLLREPSRQMKDRLHDYMHRKGLSTDGARFYSHRLPALRRETLRGLRPAGDGWAAVGDAAGLVDPITGEGLFYALRSAELLAECELAGRAEHYARRLRDDFGRDLELGARIAPRFFHGTFLGAPVIERMIQFTARSQTYAALIQDLFAGSQGYLGLKQRLFKNLSRTLLEIAASFFRPNPNPDEPSLIGKNSPALPSSR